MGIFIGVLSFSIIGFFIHYYLSPKPMTKFRVVELLLLYQLVFCVGFASFLGFIGMAFMSQYVADYLGWESGPFQIELANVNLGYAFLGILCIWFRGNFWLATVIGFSIWIFADGIHHIADSIINQNYAPGNVGIPMYTDFIVPIVLIVLTVMYQKMLREQKINPDLQPDFDP